MLKVFSRFAKDLSGATAATRFSLIVALISALIIGAAMIVGSSLDTMLISIWDSFGG